MFTLYIPSTTLLTTMSTKSFPHTHTLTHTHTLRASECVVATWCGNTHAHRNSIRELHVALRCFDCRALTFLKALCVFLLRCDAMKPLRDKYASPSFSRATDVQTCLWLPPSILVPGHGQPLQAGSLLWCEFQFGLRTPDLVLTVMRPKRKAVLFG